MEQESKMFTRFFLALLSFAAVIYCFAKHGDAATIPVELTPATTSHVLEKEASIGDTITVTCTGAASETPVMDPKNCFNSGSKGGAFLVPPTHVAISGETTLTTIFGDKGSEPDDMFNSRATAVSASGGAIALTAFTIPETVKYVGWLTCACGIGGSSKYSVFGILLKPKCTSDAIKGSCAKTGTTCIAIGCTKSLLKCP